MYLKRAVIKWLYRAVLKTSSADVKRMFRELENLQLKLVSLKSHRILNETCLNIYIYTYLYKVLSHVKQGAI